MRVEYIASRVKADIRREGLLAGTRHALSQLWTLIVHAWLKLMLRREAEGGLVVREINGYKMYLDVNDPGLSCELLRSGVREELETRLVQSVVKPGMTVVDIGANLGYYALMEAGLVGAAGRVIAIEPEPWNFAILGRAVSLNGFENMDLLCAAASDVNSWTTMHLSKASNWHSLVSIGAEHQSKLLKGVLGRSCGTTEVQTWTTDGLLEYFNTANVNFIRMDIEGHEARAIKGMEKTLRDTPAPLFLMFELHSMYFDNPECDLFPAILQLLEWGFVVHTASAGGRVVAVDDLASTLSEYRASGVSLLMEKRT